MHCAKSVECWAQLQLVFSLNAKPKAPARRTNKTTGAIGMALNERDVPKTFANLVDDVGFGMAETIEFFGLRNILPIPWARKFKPSGHCWICERCRRFGTSIETFAIITSICLTPVKHSSLEPDTRPSSNDHGHRRREASYLSQTIFLRSTVLQCRWPARQNWRSSDPFFWSRPCVWVGKSTATTSWYGPKEVTTASFVERAESFPV